MCEISVGKVVKVGGLCPKYGFLFLLSFHVRNSVFLKHLYALLFSCKFCVANFFSGDLISTFSCKSMQVLLVLIRVICVVDTRRGGIDL